MLPLHLDCVEKRETLYSVNGLFQLVHADVANLEFLGKLATHPKYCLLIVDVFSKALG